jgi:hypothetical protein
VEGQVGGVMTLTGVNKCSYWNNIISVRAFTKGADKSLA